MNTLPKGRGLLLVASCLFVSCGPRFDSLNQPDFSPAHDLRAQDFRPKNYSVGSGSPEMLARLAMIHHPQVAAMRLRAERLEAKVAQEQSLPDPNATLALGNLPETAAGQVDAVIGVSQKVPFPGKRDASARAAAHEAAAVRAEADAMALQIGEQVKSAWWDYYLADRTVKFTKENRQLLEVVRDVVGARVEANESTQAEQLRIDNEITKLDRDLSQLSQLQNSAEARINSLLNRPAGASLPSPGEVSLPGTANLDSLIARAERTHPEIMAAQQRVAAFGQKLRRAKLEKFPDLAFGIQGAAVASSGIAPSANGRDQIFGTLGFNLPLWQEPRKAMVREATAGIAETKALLESKRSDLRYRVEDAYFRAKTAREVTDLFESRLIPSAKQAYEVSLSSYAAGTDSFTNVIDTQRELLTYQLQLVRNRSQLGKAIATLQAAAATK